MQFHVVQGQQARERMNGAPVLQIAKHGDRQVVGAAEFLADGEQVEQGLGRVLARAVAGVDERLAQVLGGRGRGARFRVAQHDHVGVTFERAHGVGQRLALGHRRVVHLVDRDHAAAQALDRGNKRGRGARGRLVEQVGQHLAFEQVERADALDHRAHLLGHLKNLFEVVAPELVDR